MSFKFRKNDWKYFYLCIKMLYVFSATVKGKVYWYKNLSDLPLDEKNKYYIYPIYQKGMNIINLSREKLLLKNSSFYSDFNFFYDYLKQDNKVKFNSLFIRGDEFANVFLNEESYIDYIIKTKECHHISF